MAENRGARRVSIKYGAWTLAATVIGAIAWLSINGVAWPVKVGTVLFGYLCVDYFYSLSALAQDYRSVRQQLEALEQEKVRAFDWKTLVKHVALILGYIRHSSIEPFLIVGDEPAAPRGTSDHRAATPVIPVALRIGRRLVPSSRTVAQPTRHRP